MKYQKKAIYVEFFKKNISLLNNDIADVCVSGDNYIAAERICNKRYFTDQFKEFTSMKIEAYVTYSCEEETPCTKKEALAYIAWDLAWKIYNRDNKL